ncbi:unnamed protein product, partial [marine sediment metagenome]
LLKMVPQGNKSMIYFTIDKAAQYDTVTFSDYTTVHYA